MIARVVIGANFGDESKGLVTDWLCSQGAGIVVRFNGGAQAGHTVVTPENERHVFRHFGSGTLCGVPTFLSQFFVCNPILFFEERKQLIDLGFHPEVYAHPDCLVTTFMDMLINQAKENKRGVKRHGSCGIGFHETIVRSNVPELKITMSDLWNGGKRLESQLAELCHKYAKFRTGESYDGSEAIPEFIECCNHFAQCVNPLGIAQCKDPVFEGAQGLLLDQDNKEFFPHVTHSSTGMKNVTVLCEQAGIKSKEIYYVSRTYLTRHGAGPLPGEDATMSFADETNHPTQFQGQLRFAPLVGELIHKRCQKDCGAIDYKLVLTHCDQLEPLLGADFYCDGPTRNSVSVTRPELCSV
jgi:adenylosuccinate synthase